jgi:MFS family permease
MDHYQANTRWLTLFAPFRGLSLSAAYLTPFFLEKGLNLTEVFLLQSIFSMVCVVWELPSGWLSDRWGRANCIKWSAPLAAAAMVAYGLSSNLAQFVACEVLLAIASGLYSGADKALLYDSLAADASLREPELGRRFQQHTRRIKSAGFGAVFLGAPLSWALVHFVGLSATIVADGLLLAAGSVFAWRLVEAPYRHSRPSQATDELGQEALTVRQACRQLAVNAEVRWLVALGVVLSTATYLAAWAAAPYYASLGVPLALFGAIYALRSLLKAVLAYRYSAQPQPNGRWWKRMLRHKFLARQPENRTMWAYTGLSGAVYLAMASGQWWLAPAVVGHDVVHALHDDPISSRLNAAMSAGHRATLNSVVPLLQRLGFATAGPVAGWLVDSAGLQAGLLYVGLACGLLASLAMLRLQRLGTFREE